MMEDRADNDVSPVADATPSKGSPRLSAQGHPAAVDRRRQQQSRAASTRDALQYRDRTRRHGRPCPCLAASWPRGGRRHVARPHRSQPSVRPPRRGPRKTASARPSLGCSRRPSSGWPRSRRGHQPRMAGTGQLESSSTHSVGTSLSDTPFVVACVSLHCSPKRTKRAWCHTTSAASFSGAGHHAAARSSLSKQYSALNISFLRRNNQLMGRRCQDEQRETARGF